MRAHLQTTYHNVVRQAFQTSSCSKGTKDQFPSRHRENMLLSNRNSAAAQNVICFYAFWKFLPKIIEFLDFKAKNMLLNQKLSNHESFWIFLSSFFCSISVSQNFHSHYLSFFGQTGLFRLLCYENQSINKTSFHSAQSAMNGNFCHFCYSLLARDFRDICSRA